MPVTPLTQAYREGYFNAESEGKQFSVMTTRPSAGWDTSWTRDFDDGGDFHFVLPLVDRGVYVSYRKPKEESEAEAEQTP